MDDVCAGQDSTPDQDLAAYAGRWIALVSDQVAGVGETAMAAEQLGRRNRMRERLVIRFVEPEGGQSLLLPEQLLQLEPIFRRHEQPVHVVGGAVRDVLLGRAVKDLDFAVPKGAINLAFKVADTLGLPAYVLDRDRDAGRVVLDSDGTTLDFACYRGADLISDLRTRDFTINAMALPFAARSQASLIDPCDGQADLSAGLIRQTHLSSIDDDPIRALRAVRHARELHFAIEEGTREAVTRCAVHLDSISSERVRDELLKMVHAQSPEGAVAMMRDLGLLSAVLPEVASLDGVVQSPPHFEDAFNHTVSVLRCASLLVDMVAQDQPGVEARLAEVYRRLGPYRRQLQSHFQRRLDGGVPGWQALYLAALFHDVGKVSTMSIESDGRIRFFGHAEVGAELAANRLTQLHTSREVVRHVKMVVAGHMRPLLLAQGPELSRRAIFRFFRDYGAAGLDITFLALADSLAIRGSTDAGGQWSRLVDVVSRLHEHYFEHFEQTVQPEILVDGREVMQIAKIEPGPEVGRMLSLLVEAQAAGEVTSREQAILFLERLAKTDLE